jgi:hypothetical protein
LPCPLAKGWNFLQPYVGVEEGKDELKQQDARVPSIVPKIYGPHIFKDIDE